ncbi:hypothetical protein MASR1M107_23940 [Ignavibacteriales bacterium]
METLKIRKGVTIVSIVLPTNLCTPVQGLVRSSLVWVAKIMEIKNLTARSAVWVELEQDGQDFTGWSGFGFGVLRFVLEQDEQD